MHSECTRGTCRACGCTTTNACARGTLLGDVETCGWADDTQTLCTSCTPDASDWEHPPEPVALWRAKADPTNITSREPHPLNADRFIMVEALILGEVHHPHEDPPLCGARCSIGGFRESVCTLPRGHEGNHSVTGMA